MRNRAAMPRLCFMPSPTRVTTDLEARFARYKTQDATVANLHKVLAARERGLGTCWTTLHLAHEQEAADVAAENQSYRLGGVGGRVGMGLDYRILPGLMIGALLDPGRRTSSRTTPRHFRACRTNQMGWAKSSGLVTYMRARH